MSVWNSTAVSSAPGAFGSSTLPASTAAVSAPPPGCSAFTILSVGPAGASPASAPPDPDVSPPLSVSEITLSAERRAVSFDTSRIIRPDRMSGTSAGESFLCPAAFTALRKDCIRALIPAVPRSSCTRACRLSVRCPDSDPGFLSSRIFPTSSVSLKALPVTPLPHAPLLKIDVQKLAP